MNWKARPLVSYRVIVDLISATTTDTGLTVRRELDSADYPKGIVVSESRDGRSHHQPRCLSRRMELHHATNQGLSPSDCFRMSP